MQLNNPRVHLGSTSKRGYILILFFLLLSFFIISAPILKNGKSVTFYTIDPDVHYLSNSLLYIKSGRIQYNGHPGTPTIVSFSYVLLPLRIYSHFISKTPFITWVFRNVEFVYHYVRIYQSVLLALSTGVFLFAAYKLTGSTIIIILTWIALFLYTAFLYLGSSIAPETTSFFIISIWFLAFVSFLKSRSPTILMFMSVISGFALANKFSNLPLVLVTPALFFTLRGFNNRQKIINGLISVLFVGTFFVIGTLPVRHTYPQMFRWVTLLASTTGTHGSGKKAIFDLPSYLSSAGGLVHKEKSAVIVVATVFVLLVVFLIFKKIKFNSPVNILGFLTLSGILVFSKFPLSHYQLSNYIAVVFLGAFVVNRLPRFLKIALIILLLPLALNNISSYFNSLSLAITKARVLEEYVQAHPPLAASVWEWGRSRDFALLWTRDWASGVFGEEIELYRPNLFELGPNLESIKVSANEQRGVFDVCWDKLYIQQSTAPMFLKRYQNYPIEYTPLPNTNNMGIIESKHCITNF